MPRVSVIVPCYNQGRFLREAVVSVLNQTFSDLEVIIVNDGSTDHTETIAKDLTRDPRCRYIYQENQGLSATRNCGMEISTGSYLNFLDADDWLELTKIEEQVHILDSLPDVGFTYCDTILEYQNGRHGESYSVRSARKHLNGNIFESLLLGGYFPPHTVLIRRKILDKIGGFDPILRSCEDYDLWLRVVGSGNQAYFLDKKLTHYRLHESNMSNNRELMKANCLEVLRKAVRHFPDVFAESVAALVESTEEQYTSNRWLDSQRAYWQSETARQTELLAGYKQQVAQLEGAKIWLENQRANWQAEVEKQSNLIQSQRKWIAELEQGKGWLEEQRLSWMQIAREREIIIQQQQERITSLEQSETLLERQDKRWKQIVEQHERVINEQQQRITLLEQGPDNSTPLDG